MTDARHVLPFKRKREGRTNYKGRLALLKSGKPRLVLRRSNRHMLLQLAVYEPDGDKVLMSFCSKALHKHGWTRSTKSVPACYFSGVLLARAAVAKGIKEAIVDIGLQKHRAGTRLCAAIKGAIDGGLAVPADETIFPSSERIAGKHIGIEPEIAAFAAKLSVTLPKHETAPTAKALKAAAAKQPAGKEPAGKQPAQKQQAKQPADKPAKAPKSANPKKHEE